jgi:hypothetical protein
VPLYMKICVGGERAVSCFRSKLRECIIAADGAAQASSFLPTTKRRYASRMSLFAWQGQPRGYRKCPVAYNAAARADPLSERIVGNSEVEFPGQDVSTDGLHVTRAQSPRRQG